MGNDWQDKKHIRIVLITILSVGQFQFPDNLREEFKFSSLRAGLNEHIFAH